MASKDLIEASNDLLRRLNPKNTTENLNSLISLFRNDPTLTEDLLSDTDQPLLVARDSENREYLLCDWNRDGDSYRSPWTNKYTPELEDGTYPSDALRNREIAANQAFDVYRELYYDRGVSSVYLWNQENNDFAGVVLFKKSVGDGAESKGTWDSIHVFEAKAVPGKAKFSYKLTSTVILNMVSSGETIGEMDLSGNMTRQSGGIFDVYAADLDSDREQDRERVDADHIANIGKLVEDLELDMRNLLQEVYFGKAKDVVANLRSVQSLSQANRDRLVHQEMISSMSKR
ncbi:F-actin-capping protein subunit beta [Pyronema domesticum]|uniref:F-actin-capping protein subunit beta n=1 Tax=Pyronema omphalodes (strain CBS 100304) TaxID=1076935 RepID=U4LUD1_PYROM|nr:F-actin-capping protein subunit beta [Pyronema domesticum]CCX33595.1 Similar to F-actin-capping protein subunit beta; acc. no. Q2URJ3 [Pyronema omphalodes CBS 100304]